METPSEKQRPGEAPHCGWDSPRSSTSLRTQQGFMLFRWLSCILRCDGLLLSLTYLTCQRLNASLFYYLPWRAVRMRAAALRKFSNPSPSLHPMEPLGTGWKNGSQIQSENTYPVEEHPLVGKSQLNLTERRSPEYASSFSFSPWFCSV